MGPQEPACRNPEAQSCSSPKAHPERPMLSSVSLLASKIPRSLSVRTRPSFPGDHVLGELLRQFSSRRRRRPASVPIPLEILRVIFLHLSPKFVLTVCSRVSRAWQSAIQGLAWQDRTFYARAHLRFSLGEGRQGTFCAPELLFGDQFEAGESVQLGGYDPEISAWRPGVAGLSVKINVPPNWTRICGRTEDEDAQVWSDVGYLIASHTEVRHPQIKLRLLPGTVKIRTGPWALKQLAAAHRSSVDEKRAAWITEHACSMLSVLRGGRFRRVDLDGDSILLWASLPPSYRGEAAHHVQEVVLGELGTLQAPNSDFIGTSLFEMFPNLRAVWFRTTTASSWLERIPALLLSRLESLVDATWTEDGVERQYGTMVHWRKAMQLRGVVPSPSMLEYGPIVIPWHDGPISLLSLADRKAIVLSQFGGTTLRGAVHSSVRVLVCAIAMDPRREIDVQDVKVLAGLLGLVGASFPNVETVHLNLLCQTEYGRVEPSGLASLGETVGRWVSATLPARRMSASVLWPAAMVVGGSSSQGPLETLASGVRRGLLSLKGKVLAEPDSYSIAVRGTLVNKSQ